jgi:NADH-quinone oxidoreductase subunit I
MSNLDTVWGAIKGLGITIRHVFKEPRVTVQYPEERKPHSPRHRGVHEQRLTPDGRQLCVGCSLCAAACPADCIYVEAGEEEVDSGRYLSPERFSRVYKINYSRCIFCGYCVEACPTYALGMTEIMDEYTFDNRWTAIFDMDMLVANYKRRLRAEGIEVPETLEPAPAGEAS